MSLLFARPGEVERPRVRITSVPYALKASDAETLGGLPRLGLPAGARRGGRASAARPTPRPRRRGGGHGRAAVAADLVLPGTTNFLAKYVNGAAGTVGNSGVFETRRGGGAGHDDAV